MERCLALWTEPLPEPSTCSDAASPPSPVRRLLPSFLFVSFFFFLLCVLTPVSLLSSTPCAVSHLMDSPWSRSPLHTSSCDRWVFSGSLLHQRCSRWIQNAEALCVFAQPACACVCVGKRERESERERQTAVSLTQIWIQIKMISAGICREMQTRTDWSLKNIQGAERRWEKMRDSGLTLAVLHLTDAPMKCY